jgi:hypothetical protein
MSGPTLTSMTSTQEEMEHALSENWRTPPQPKEAVAAPAVAEPEAPEVKEPEKPAVSEPAESQEQPKEKRSGWQKRIDKLTARNHQLAKELEAERAKRAEPAEKAATPPEDREPKMLDFKTVEEFLEARDSWKDRQQVKQIEEENRKLVFDTYNDRVEQARGKYEDFDEIVAENSKTQIPQSVYLAVVEMENGPDVAYYLGKHPEVCDELMDMSQLAAVRRIERIAVQLESGKPSETPKPNEKPKPPAPIAPVGSTATASSVPLDKMAPREFIRIRNQQERDRKRR